MASHIKQSVPYKRGDKVEIHSKAPLMKIQLSNGKYSAFLWAVYKNGKHSIFKTEKEARDYSGVRD